ncbi:CRE-DHS-11 protein [Caenorhabditis remanei]|uniref:(3R)-3-hydroxyacyl-CoA dehydrogenase n=1 Tax=Caenorhabditis remanei TaxID=31234 RepID=E3LZF6_CAERE|nr:CRE-DHS-11 protein [Caenorhabditis remanei]
MLSSKLAIVTGGGSGIGQEICKKLASSGAQLIVADLKKSSAESTAKLLPGSGHTAFQIDVSKYDDVERLKEFIQSSGHHPGVLVNCAGITKDSTLLKMSREQWDDVINVNLNSIFMMSQMIARESVKSQTSLSIVNVSSIVGKIGNFGQTNYSATKAGVIGFTKSAARELATKNVRVNAILPGFIRTPMTEAMPPKVLEAMISMVPQRRLGEPEEIANAVLFLASDMSSYVTGATIEVTGGLGM